jgi:hypothetical protein
VQPQLFGSQTDPRFARLSAHHEAENIGYNCAVRKLFNLGSERHVYICFALLPPRTLRRLKASAKLCATSHFDYSRNEMLFESSISTERRPSDDMQSKNVDPQTTAANFTGNGCLGLAGSRKFSNSGLSYRALELS